MKTIQLQHRHFSFADFLAKLFHHQESKQKNSKLVKNFTDSKDNKKSDLKLVYQKDETTIQQKTDLTKINSSEFFAATVHELKNPLSAIIGLAEILKSELKAFKTNSECDDYINDIILSATEMNELVHDILDVEAAALSGNFSVDLSKEIDLKNVIKRSVKLNYDYSLKRGINLKTEIAADLKPIKLDAKRLKQVLTNLISNAVKYSSKATEIKITAQNLVQNNQEFLEICVVDHGFGMTESQVATAFQKYKTIQNPNSKNVDSFGLGLPITKQLVELQNGTIEVKSKINHGTEIKLKFPYQL